MAEEQVEITPFDKLFPIPLMVRRLVETRGLDWVLANSYYIKYKPCMLCAIYYRYKDIEYVRPVAAAFREDGSLGFADFGDFAISFNEETGRYEYVITDEKSVEEKYGKDFVKYIGLVGAANEDAVCRILLTAIINYETKKEDLTFEGIRALFTVAAMHIQNLRYKPPALPKEAEELIRAVKPEERERVKVIRLPEVEAPRVKEIPELDAVANLIRYIASKYKMSVDDVLDLLSRYLS